MLFHVLSNPKLLRDLRSELFANVAFESSSGEYGCKEVRLSSTVLGSLCPLLNSTLKEVLRCHSTSLSARIVMKDTVLNRQYLLKAGSVIQIPAAVLHKDPHSWGAKAAKFDAARFHTPDEEMKLSQRPAAASRAFGGGSTLCPGRRLATTEILIFVSIFLLQYNAEPIDGPWSLPTLNFANMTNSVMPPPQELRVKITKRRGVGKAKWVPI